MHSRLTHVAAQQHIADLHRAADHNRLAHTATSSNAVPEPRCTAASSRSCAGSAAAWLIDHRERLDSDLGISSERLADGPVGARHRSSGGERGQLFRLLG